MSYRIAHAELFVVTVPFRFRFQHAAADRVHNDSIFIKIKTECGRIGWGETLTRSYLTGETPESVIAALSSWWPDLRKLAFSGEDPEPVLSPMQVAADRQGKNAAWSLVDVACYDLWLRGLASEVRSSQYNTPVTCPVGLGRASGWLPYLARAAGFQRFKFKIGPQWEAADRRIAAARGLVTVDANMALEGADVGAVASWLKTRNVQYIEQPFAVSNDEQAAALVRTGAATVVADESLCSLAHAEHIARARTANGFNVRLAKLGGITGARAVVQVARQHGLKVQLGALVGESDLLSNAARFCLPTFRPDLFEYSFPGILLAETPVRSSLPRWTAVMKETGFQGTGFGQVDEPWLRSRARLTQVL